MLKVIEGGKSESIKEDTDPKPRLSLESFEKFALSAIDIENKASKVSKGSSLNVSSLEALKKK